MAVGLALLHGVGGPEAERAHEEDWGGELGQSHRPCEFKTTSTCIRPDVPVSSSSEMTVASRTAQRASARPYSRQMKPVSGGGGCRGSIIQSMESIDQAG